MVRVCLQEEGMAFPVSNVWREKLVFWSFSLPSLLGGILASGAGWALNVILVHESDSFQGIAVLNASRQWLSALTFLPVAVGAGTMPALSSVTKTLHDGNAVKEALRVPSVLVRVSIWPVTLTLFLLSPEILKAYGPSYTDGIWTFLWMIGGVAVGYTGYIGSLLVQSRGMMWFAFTHQVVYTVVSITIGYLLCRTSGELGIAQGVAAGYAALLLWMLANNFPLKLARDILRDGFVMIGLVVLLSHWILHVPATVRLAVTVASVAAFGWQIARLREFRDAVSAKLSARRRAT
jgi:O-antigen/teichoic acid export membrane protein